MSVDRNPVPPVAGPTCRVRGRIASIDWYPRQKPTRFNTLVRLPAADEFTTPATVEVTSDVSLGEEGEVIDVTCQVGGRYRSYTVEDKKTGEKRTVRTADNLLTCNARS